MDKYGLIGFPLGHSFSKNFFNEKFEKRTSTLNTSTSRFRISKNSWKFST